MKRIVTVLVLGAAVSLAAEIDPKDFTATWEPLLPSRMQWVKITHTPSASSFRLKLAWCVSDKWKLLPPVEALAARKAWLVANATAYLQRVLYEESDIGIRERLIAEAKQHKQNVLAAQAFCEKLKLDYPAYAGRIPTITVTGGEE